MMIIKLIPLFLPILSSYFFTYLRQNITIISSYRQSKKIEKLTQQLDSWTEKEISAPLSSHIVYANNRNFLNNFAAYAYRKKIFNHQLLQIKKDALYLPPADYLSLDFPQHSFALSSRKIFIDRYPILLQDFLQHLSQFKNYQITFDRTKNIDLTKNFVTLSSIEQMKRYCQLQGGQLLPSYLFDAASLNPSNHKLLHQLNIYPDLTFSIISCRYIWAQECLNIPFQLNSGISWSSIHFVLGGPLEYLSSFTTPFHIKLSSYYYPTDSIYHQLMHRGSIKGEISNLNISYQLPSSSWAFRCFYEILP